MPYNDSWYRIADLRLGLLPNIEVHKQLYRGETWYVLQHPGSAKYFRVRPEAYRFICALTPGKTVADIWRQALAHDPGQAPDQGEVVQLLVQLHHANLLFFRSQGDQDAIFDRFRQQRGRERMGRLLALLYLKIPLWNPERFLNRTRNLLTPLFAPPMLVLWALAMAVFIKLAIENWDRLWVAGAGVLAPANLPLLYLCVFVLKLFHEMAHALVCKRYGGQVHSMGLMFIVFTPLPYIDASASWSMRNRWQRAYVGAAGMIVELLFASVAMLVWLYTGPGFVNSLAFNLILAGSVSALVFNGNPLLRFDAYYILSDLAELPNLYQKSAAQWLYYGDRYLFGTERAQPAAQRPRETVWFTVYGALSVIYRLVIMVTITFLVADIWLGLGVVMVIMMAALWIVIPGSKLIRYLARHPRLSRNRARAVAVVAGCLGGLMALVAWLPLPAPAKAPGVVLSDAMTALYSQSPGRLVDVHASDGDWLEAGALIATLDSDALRYELRIVQQQLRESEWLLRQAIEADELDPDAFRNQVESLRTRESVLQERIDGLTVRAQSAGVWQGTGLKERVGTQVPRGELLGHLVDTRTFRFSAIIPQSKAATLFGRSWNQGEIRLSSQNERVIAVNELRLVPYQQRQLPSPALAVSANGPIPTRIDAQGRQEAVESFYVVTAALPETDGIVLRHGVTGTLLIRLDHESLADQLARHVRQAIQRRYGL